jgi:hypothetical protein
MKESGVMYVCEGELRIVSACVGVEESWDCECLNVVEGDCETNVNV